MKEPIFVAEKIVSAIQYTGDNKDSVEKFIIEHGGSSACVFYTLSYLNETIERGEWFCESYGHNGEKYILICSNDKFIRRFKTCEAPRGKESPACSPHTGFKVVDKKNKSANYIDDALSVLWGLKNHRMALYPDKENLMKTYRPM